MIIPFRSWRASAHQVAFLVIAAAVFSAPAHAWADEAATEADALDPLRERFRAGMEKYRAGAFAEAIVIWEKIYGELGAEKGYRLAFNLARAYEQFGDPTRAAEFYDAYVKETRSRHDAGETAPPLVEKQEREAKERLRELAATQGRIRIGGESAVVVKVDGGADRLMRAGFVLYVTPDRSHSLTFHPGTKEERIVQVIVALGEQKEVSPVAPAKVEAPAPLVTPPPTARFETREERPFGRSVIYIGASLTVLSAIVPVILYANARAVQEEYDAPTASYSEKVSLAEDYETARTNAYASIAIPAVLGAATIGLAAYWVWGAKETRVPVTGSIVPGGGTIGASARF